MKFISKLLSVAAIALTLASCDKKDALTTYANGSAPKLESSSVNVAPQAVDSLNTVLTLRWSDPRYTSSMGTKYVIQIDSATKGFSMPYTRTITNGNLTTFIGKDLNEWMLARGYAFNVPVKLEARVISSYSNNNEPLNSNVVLLTAIPYRTPPRVTVPATDKLFLVGNASDGGWNNPVPVPSQEFSKLDATTWAGVFHLNAGGEFLVLPANGLWDKKYALSDNSVSGITSGGVFGYHVDGQASPDIYTQNFKGPAASGNYKIVLDFQTGRFTVTPWAGMLPGTSGVGSTLYLVGGATADGWNNSNPSVQQFTRLNSSEFSITIPLTGGGEFLILPIAGDWNQKFALKDNSVAGVAAGGEFGYKGAGTPGTYDSNFKAPAASGTRTIKVNLAGRTTSTDASGTYTIQ